MLQYNNFPEPTNPEKLREYLQFVLGVSEESGVEYKEGHHILPRCLGGSDSLWNIKLLSLRNHFIAHKLLAEAYESDLGIAYAAFMMSHKSATPEEYESVRSHYYEIRKNAIIDRNKSWVPMHLEDSEVTVHVDDIETYLSLGYIIGMSPSHKRKLGDAHRGKKRSEETIQKISESNSNTHIGDIWINNGEKEITIPDVIFPEYEELGYMKGRLPFSEEHRKNLSREFSEEHRKNISISAKNRRYDLVCKCCGKNFKGKSWNSSLCSECRVVIS